MKFYEVFDYSKLIEVYNKAKKNSKYEEELVKYFYSLAEFIVMSNYRIFTKEDKQDLIQHAVEICYNRFRGNTFDEKKGDIKQYFLKIIREEVKLQYIRMHSMDIEVVLEVDNFYFLKIEEESNYSVRLWNYCISKIRFRNNERLLCKYILWFLIFEEKFEKTIIFKNKVKLLKLESRLSFLNQYCEVLYRQSLDKFKNCKGEI